MQAVSSEVVVEPPLYSGAQELSTDKRFINLLKDLKDHCADNDIAAFLEKLIQKSEEKHHSWLSFQKRDDENAWWVSDSIKMMEKESPKLTSIFVHYDQKSHAAQTYMGLLFTRAFEEIIKHSQTTKEERFGAIKLLGKVLNMESSKPTESASKKFDLAKLHILQLLNDTIIDTKRIPTYSRDFPRDWHVMSLVLLKDFNKNHPLELMRLLLFVEKLEGDFSRFSRKKDLDKLIEINFENHPQETVTILRRIEQNVYDTVTRPGNIERNSTSKNKENEEYLKAKREMYEQRLWHEEHHKDRAAANTLKAIELVQQQRSNTGNRPHPSQQIQATTINKNSTENLPYDEKTNIGFDEKEPKDPDQPSDDNKALALPGPVSNGQDQALIDPEITEFAMLYNKLIEVVAEKASEPGNPLEFFRSIIEGISLQISETPVIGTLYDELLALSDKLSNLLS